MLLRSIETVSLTTFLLIIYFAVAELAVSSDNNESIFCSIELQPFGRSDDAIINALRDLAVVYNNELCSFKPFEAGRSRRAPLFARAGVRCKGANRVIIRAQSVDYVGASLIEIKCSVAFPIDLHADMELSFDSVVRFARFNEGSFVLTYFGQPSRIDAVAVYYNVPFPFSGNYTFYSVANSSISLTIDLCLQPVSNVSQDELVSVSELELVIERDIGINIICRENAYQTTGVFKSGYHESGMYLVSAGSGNPTETRLLLNCLKSKKSDCSKQINRGVPEHFGGLKLDIIPQHGVAYCSQGDLELFLEYFSPVNKFDAYDNMSLIWEDENVIQIQKDDEANNFLVPRYSFRRRRSLEEVEEYSGSGEYENFNESDEVENDEVLIITQETSEATDLTFYESQYLSLECHFLEYFLRPSIIWIAKYANGTEKTFNLESYITKEQKQYESCCGDRGGVVKRNTSVFVSSSHAKVPGEVGMTVVECRADYWNYAGYASATYPVNVTSLSEAICPGFLANESVHTAILGTPLQLNCSADFAKPIPQYAWEFRGKKEMDSKATNSSKTFYQVSAKSEGGRKYSVMTIQSFGVDMEGEYICLAKNVRENASRRFKINPLTEEATVSSRGTTLYFIFFSGIIAILGVILLVLAKQFWSQKDRLTAMEIKIFEKGNETELRVDKFAHENAQFMPYNKAYEIKWEDFTISCRLFIRYI